MFLSLPYQSSISPFVKVDKEAGTYNTKLFSVFQGGLQTQPKGKGSKEGDATIILASSARQIALINSVASAFLDGRIVSE